MLSPALVVQRCSPSPPTISQIISDEQADTVTHLTYLPVRRRAAVRACAVPGVLPTSPRLVRWPTPWPTSASARASTEQRRISWLPPPHTHTRTPHPPPRPTAALRRARRAAAAACGGGGVCVWGGEDPANQLAQRAAAAACARTWFGFGLGLRLGLGLGLGLRLWKRQGGVQCRCRLELT